MGIRAEEYSLLMVETKVFVGDDKVQRKEEVTPLTVGSRDSATLRVLFGLNKPSEFNSGYMSWTSS
jgi:hypothetical protein